MSCTRPCSHDWRPLGISWKYTPLESMLARALPASTSSKYMSATLFACWRLEKSLAAPVLAASGFRTRLSGWRTRQALR
eukprot:10191443-Alexandrium_andersonii.AAC.1